MRYEYYAHVFSVDKEDAQWSVEGENWRLHSVVSLPNSLPILRQMLCIFERPLQDERPLRTRRLRPTDKKKPPPVTADKDHDDNQPG